MRQVHGSLTGYEEAPSQPLVASPPPQTPSQTGVAQCGLPVFVLPGFTLGWKVLGRERTELKAGE